MMNADPRPPDLSSEPAPAMPGGKKKSAWKKPFVVLFGIIGVIASTSTVVALVLDAIDPDTTEQDQTEMLGEIDKKLTASNEDGHLINQVSRRVTELSDEYKRIQQRLQDVRRLHRSLAKSPAGLILTPDQRRIHEASRKQEIEELLAQLDNAEKMAKRFVASVETDETLGQVRSVDSKTAKTKSKAIEQARQVREALLAELAAIRSKYE